MRPIVSRLNFAKSRILDKKSTAKKSPDSVRNGFENNGATDEELEKAKIMQHKEPAAHDVRTDLKSKR